MEGAYSLNGNGADDVDVDDVDDCFGRNAVKEIIQIVIKIVSRIIIRHDLVNSVVISLGAR